MNYIKKIKLQYILFVNIFLLNSCVLMGNASVMVLDAGLMVVGIEPTNAYQPLFKPKYSSSGGSSYSQIKYQYPKSYQDFFYESEIWKWKDCTDFKNKVRCGSYEIKKEYISKNNYNYYLKHYESDVQILVDSQPVQIAANFLKISDRVYFKGQLIKNANPLYFEVISDFFTIRNDDIYYLDNKLEVLDRKSWIVIIYNTQDIHGKYKQYDPLNSSAYNVYNKHDRLGLNYSKDDQAIYCKNNVLTTDVENFTYVVGSRYFKDSDNVYDMTTCNTIELDPNSFEIVWNEDYGRYSGYIKDNNKVIYTGKDYKTPNVVIKSIVDPTSFQMLCSKAPGEYSIDKIHVYSHLVILKYEDPKSFKPPENCDNGFENK
ncbi:MAG: DKNYY domain-containing protein [Saccharospirillaceae bacterium]|nr:DKNYY domain-containing protein [Pseudomonadales bacterium]NRB78925.1 DKNYY domain-containing protein [Saccharospirillaceae bacterium]